VFGLEGSTRHILGHAVVLGGLGFGGVGWFDDELTHIDEGRPLKMKTWPLEAQRLLQEVERLASYAKTPPLGGMPSSFRALFFCKYEL
jgi:hypothetical protein